ncbi:MAG: sigma-70 family RNA polymerase sigma factor [Peptococcaceae bacterium]|nr:sigma-70 family RNA polymerase sigma factor [Peptococcaceae bacterium]
MAGSYGFQARPSGVGRPEGLAGCLLHESRVDMALISRNDIENYYEDIELVKRVISKDSEALEKLYFKYLKRLTCFVGNSSFISSDDVQDVLQNTFMAVLDSLGEYQGRSQFFTWICGIARHKIVDYQRAKTRRIDSMNKWPVGEYSETIPSNDLLVEESVLSQEMSLKIQSIIGMMPEHYQILLIEKYIHRKTLKELAAARAMTEKAVESLLTRAKKHFRYLVKQNEYFSGDGSYE